MRAEVSKLEESEAREANSNVTEGTERKSRKNMATATFNGKVIAQSDDTTMVEGNHYFPLDSLDKSVVTETDRRSTCFWKGEASYYTVSVDGEVAENAAWYYPEPKEGAEDVANRVAFYPVVTVTD